MTKSLPLLFLVLALSIVRGAPLTADLGQGLVYHRAHALPAELPNADSPRGQPCVLDLRFATGDADAAAALESWLKSHALPRTPVFVLANAATSSPVRAVLAHRTANSPSLVVIGPQAAAFAPDLTLAVDADADRAAYDAADQGTPLAKLITEIVEKSRNDEASIARERLAPPNDSDTPRPPPPDSPPAPATTPAPPPPPALLDRVLQRAVQLHRALLALKKI